MDEQVQGANITPSTPETVTEGTQTRESASASAPSTSETPKGKTYTDADVQKMIKDRIRRERQEREKFEGVYKALRQKGVINTDNPDEVLAWAATYTPEGEPDPIQAAKFEADKVARSTAMDVRIEMKAEEAAKDPLYAELSDHEVVQDLMPLARQLNGDVKAAFRAKYGDVYEQRREAMLEAKITSNIAAKANKKVESGEAGGEAEKLGLDPSVIAMAKARGIDLQKLAALSKVKNLDDYEKLKKK